MEKERREILICRNLEEVGQRAANLYVQLANEVISSTERFAVALSGGSTPKALYALLASDQYRQQVPWSKVHVFWGDERCVPPDHPDSNYRMTRQSLLDKVPIPEENIHRMPVERGDHCRAAAEYEETLRSFFQIAAGEQPHFDLILLGMGADGHTSSLFPWTAALAETERLITSNYVEKLGTYRLTLTAPVINRAANVVFLVSGETKASVLREVLEGAYEPQRLPSQLIRPVKGRLLFIVDRAAAGKLARAGGGRDGKPRPP
ncbi:MAG: 6-phosphogluconolactonase [Candidatus Methylomirabilales bacterium]